MLGAVYGDIVGSVYEFNNIKTKKFQLFGAKSRFTDDTVMTVAVADALIQLGNSRDINTFKNILVEKMHCYGEKYPHAGYGGNFGCWLKGKQTKPYGSYGNGSAMRVSPVAWYANSLEEAIDFAKASAEVTHNHEEGIKGAVVTAGATYLARTGATVEEIKAFVSKYYKIDFTIDEIRPTYEFNETCQDTVPQAMQAFFESVSFEDAIRNGVSLGGDTDTLCAITGTVAEAYYGMTEREQDEALSRLDKPLRDVTMIFRVEFA